MQSIASVLNLGAESEEEEYDEDIEKDVLDWDTSLPDVEFVDEPVKPLEPVPEPINPWDIKVSDTAAAGNDEWVTSRNSIE